MALAACDEKVDFLAPDWTPDGVKAGDSTFNVFFELPKSRKRISKSSKQLAQKISKVNRG